MTDSTSATRELTGRSTRAPPGYDARDSLGTAPFRPEYDPELAGLRSLDRRL